MYTCRVFRPVHFIYSSLRLNTRISTCTSGFAKMSGAENEPKRPQFGNRHLTDPEKVFEHNAWDNVEWDEEQESAARKKVEANSQTYVEKAKQEEYETESDRFWDDFYSQHQNRFFKDRNWLFTEFPELLGGRLLSDFPIKVDANLEGENNSLGCRNSEFAKNNLDIDKTIDEVSRISIAQTVQNIVPHDTNIESHDTQSSKLEEKQRNVQELDELDTNNSTKPSVLTQETGESDRNIDNLGDFPGKTSNFRIFEVGCGVGNTVYPVLETNSDPGVFMYCCDLSPTAIQLVKEHEGYKEGRCHAFVCDVTDEKVNLPFPENSLDVITLIFVMSAIHPDKLQPTVTRLAKCLKPGGMILFRDYGRYDLAQLRFKNGQCLSDNFYVRGHGTRVYFFTQEDLRQCFTKAGLVEKLNYMDRRLQVNRGRQLKMYRVWIQCKYQKPLS